jgi:hypothetical protein
MKKCNYYAESLQEGWVPSCCVEEGYAIYDVHPYDVNEYCQFCGGKVKLKPFTKHPSLIDDSDT